VDETGGTETEPSPDPEPGDDPDPAPIVPAAPPWSFVFSTSTESIETCDCDGTSRVQTQASPLEGGGLRFSQVVNGAAVDAAGEVTWPFYLLQEGSIVRLPNGEIDPAASLLEYRFGLESGAGTHLYYGAAALTEAVTNDDGSTLYRFEGTFNLMEPETAAPGLPSQGSVTATIGVWQDGTIFVGSLSLQEIAV
jgi:hypothetical protein